MTDEQAVTAAEELIPWLTAQLDEDERIARKAASLCGCHPAAAVWLFGDESTDGRIVIAGDPHPDVRRKLSRRWSGSYDGLFAAEHVARHDPARVLREVEAKRRIMDLHRPVRKRSTSGLGEDIIEDCQMCDHFPAQYPCATIRLLALPYADRPGYRQEWAP